MRTRLEPLVQTFSTETEGCAKIAIKQLTQYHVKTERSPSHISLTSLNYLTVLTQENTKNKSLTYSSYHALSWTYCLR